MTYENEVRLFDHDQGVMLMFYKSDAAFSDQQRAAILDELCQSQQRILELLEKSPDEIPDNTVRNNSPMPYSDDDPGPNTWGTGYGLG